MSGAAAGLGTWLTDWLPLALAGRWGPALAHAALMTAGTLGAVGLGLAAGAALR